MRRLLRRRMKSQASDISSTARHVSQWKFFQALFGAFWVIAHPKTTSNHFYRLPKNPFNHLWVVRIFPKQEKMLQIPLWLFTKIPSHNPWEMLPKLGPSFNKNQFNFTLCFNWGPAQHFKGISNPGIVFRPWKFSRFPANSLKNFFLLISGNFSFMDSEAPPFSRHLPKCLRGDPIASSAFSLQTPPDDLWTFKQYWELWKISGLVFEGARAPSNWRGFHCIMQQGSDSVAASNNFTVSLFLEINWALLAMLSVLSGEVRKNLRDTYDECDAQWRRCEVKRRIWEVCCAFACFSKVFEGKFQNNRGCCKNQPTFWLLLIVNSFKVQIESKFWKIYKLVFI